MDGVGAQVDPTRLGQIRVVARTARWIALDKPTGVLSVPGRGAEKAACAVSWVREHVAGASGPMVVHRLDMDTSGLLLLGLDEESQRELSWQFERRRVEKAYVALVEGHVRAQGGTIDAPMRLDPDNRPVQVIDPVQGRPAVTRWRLLAYEPDRSRLELIPLTGRTHQLRVHCAFGGPGGLAGPAGSADGFAHPIVGDVLYGRPDSAGRAGHDGERLMLHAQRLAFDEPGGGGRVELDCPCPF
jgi:tRNA pseudouridine32 synthase/23S rRNA pseudouridine746 synthase